MEDIKRSRTAIISLGRVNTIMKSSSDVDNVSKESSLIMSKAAELFIKTLSQEGYNETYSCQGRRLDYKHLANIIHSVEKYNFLRDIMPKKITVLEFKEKMAKKEAEERKRTGQEETSEDESGSSGGEEESTGSNSES